MFTNDDDGDQEEAATDTTISWYTCFSSYLLLLKEILMFTNDDDGDQEEAATDTRPHHGKQGVL